MVMGDIVNMLPAIVFSLVGVALIVLLIEVIKFMKVTRETIVNIKPNVEVTMQNVETLSTDIQPTLAKVDPMMDSLQLTVDAVNLEMMRVDQILEDVSEITEAASSATSAVDTITNAPVKAVTGVASKMRSRFGSKKASDESTQLGEQRAAVEDALEAYKAADEQETQQTDEASAKAVEEVPEPDQPEQANDAPKSYVKEFEEGSEPVIDPKVIAESPFFDGEEDAK